MLLLRNLAYNASSHAQQRQAAGAAGGGDALQEWSGGELLPAVRRVLEHPGPSTAVRAALHAARGPCHAPPAHLAQGRALHPTACPLSEARRGCAWPGRTACVGMAATTSLPPPSSTCCS